MTGPAGPQDASVACPRGGPRVAKSRATGCGFAAAQVGAYLDEFAAMMIVGSAPRDTVRAISIVYAIAGLGTPDLLIILVVLGLLLDVFAAGILAVAWLVRRR